MVEISRLKKVPISWPHKWQQLCSRFWASRKTYSTRWKGLFQQKLTALNSVKSSKTRPTKRTF